MNIIRMAILGCCAIASCDAVKADTLIMGPTGRVLTVPHGATIIRTPLMVRPVTSVQTFTTTTVGPVERTVTAPVLITPRQSDFNHRLNMLQDQIQLGLERGMLDQATADALSNEKARLAFVLANMKARGHSSIDDATLEKEINVFNRNVSDAMQ
ncbi:MAG: hypothetical protein K2W95_32665 [Candidatus Obscuribacterales bacterium]|nr:hypothetical protein [Candidatus Obscuribacterales bacterium]